MSYICHENIVSFNSIIKASLESRNANCLIGQDKLIPYSYARYALLDFINSTTSMHIKEVWFPSYFCEDALQRLRDKNIRILFYPVKNNLAPDFDKFQANIRKGSVFVLVHYFGFPNDLARAYELCKKYALVLLEDYAHTLPNAVFEWPMNDIKHGAIFSIRKVLPLVNGAFLHFPEQCPDQRNVHSDKSTFLLDGTWVVKNMLKRILSRYLIKIKQMRKLKQNSSYHKTKPMHDVFMSRLSMKLLSLYEKDLDGIVSRRRNNYLYLHEKVLHKRIVRPLFQALDLCVCPYAYPLISDKKERLQQCLNANGCEALSWPTLPPEVAHRSEYSPRGYAKYLISILSNFSNVCLEEYISFHASSSERSVNAQ